MNSRKSPLRIGVTSQNFRTVTGHAGKSRRFLIYSGTGPDDVVELPRLDLPMEMSMHAFRGDDHPVFDLDVLITGGCGDGFRQRLARHQVTVVATAEADPLTAALAVINGEELAPAKPHTH